MPNYIKRIYPRYGRAILTKRHLLLKTIIEATLKNYKARRFLQKKSLSAWSLSFLFKPVCNSQVPYLKYCPGRNSGEWYSPRALELALYSPYQNKLVPISNFTPFDEATFSRLRQDYLDWKKALTTNRTGLEEYKQFTEDLYTVYDTIAGLDYLEAYGKSLHYPSKLQLKIERIYFQYPWIDGLLFFYIWQLFPLLHFIDLLPA